jgi:protein O-GlcNAc transferase
LLLKLLLATLRKPRTSTPVGALQIEHAMRLMSEDRHAEAEVLLIEALAAAPGDVAAAQLLGNLALQRGQADAALAYLDTIRSAPTAETGFMRAQALVKLGRMDDALAAYRELRQSFPLFAPGHGAFGTLLSALGRWDEAVDALREASRLEPRSAVILNNLGHALRRTGEMREATAAFAAAHTHAPEMIDACHARLFGMHYLPETTPAAIFAAAREFNMLYAAPLAATPVRHSNIAQAERPLRVGYVSGDFKRHPVGYFIESVIEHHDRASFSVTCYSTVAAGDDLTQRIAARADVWRIVEHLDDVELTAAIRADGIDLLVDLSGHTRGARLLVFARRPAPLQLTWLGYLDTTGLDAIDYIIVDPFFLPPAGAGQCLSEAPLVLPRSYLCYRPPEYAPAVTPLPALRTGVVRFGCFNNLAKLNEIVISLWAQVLKAVPAGILVLKTHGLAHQRSREWIIARFTAHGIAAERLDLDQGAPHGELLAAYGEIDLALDPFPYTGGLTTLEALWMGVPVITLAGDTLLGRMGVTCVVNAGLAEFVAATPDEYVEIARRCASDLPRLAQRRAEMRSRLLKTTLIDGAAFTRDLESGYRQIWRRWCENAAGSPRTACLVGEN